MTELTCQNYAYAKWRPILFQSSQHLIKKRIKGGIVTSVQLRPPPPSLPLRHTGEAV